ncbi:MAG: hypothetical protein K2Z81_23915 [Cyanobacteria bacterium]|nr:hypothetical protein [Cyanobacteriota bacterium]
MSSRVIGVDEEQKFDYEEFVESVAGYRYEQRKETQVKRKIMKALSNLGAATFNLCSHIEAQFKDDDNDHVQQIISAELIDDAVFIKAGKRRLTFMILYGVGSDRDLPGGRGERCGQIGAFVHLADQDEAPLASRLYIYGDGSVSDGQTSWNIEEGNEAFLPYVAKIMKLALFELDLVWRPTEKLAKPFSMAPVEDGKIIVDFLRRSAVSFNVRTADESPEEL